MKNINTILAVGTVAAVCGATEAAIYYGTSFATYANGGLVGQNGWAQTGTSATNPIQVTGGEAVLGTTGQDVYAAFSSNAPVTAGTTLYYSATLKVTSAQAAGDYFFHLSDPAGTTSNFYGRVFAKSSGSGFLLGMSPNTTTATYGSSVLNFNQTYQVVVAWDFVNGVSNDSFSLFVDPNSTNRGDLTSYVSVAFASGAEPSTQVSAINLRQGTAANAPAIRVASLAAGSTLADVGVVPAPGAMALLGVAGLLGARRRR
jgi:MYXO-CTERM domain-containing protein